MRMSSLAQAKNGAARLRRKLPALAVPVALTLVFAHASSSTADELGKDPAFGEIWQKSQSLRPQLSAISGFLGSSHGRVYVRTPNLEISVRYAQLGPIRGIRIVRTLCRLIGGRLT
jgi:hypothetical protein